MPSSIINSDDGSVSGSTGLKTTGGDDGVLNIQTNGVTAMSVDSSQVVNFANPPTGLGVFPNFGTPLDTQTFNSSGTWTKPSAGEYALVYLWGAGGSGGKGVASGPAGGGGGGGCNIYMFRLSDLTSTVSVTIGAGGVGQTTGSTAGNNGGNSTFGAYGTAYGGSGGGYNAGGGGGGGGGGATSAGSNPGTSSNGGAGGTDSTNRLFSSPLLTPLGPTFYGLDGSGFSESTDLLFSQFAGVETQYGFRYGTTTLVKYLGSEGANGGSGGNIVSDARAGQNNIFTSWVQRAGNTDVSTLTTGGFGGGGGGGGLDTAGSATVNAGGNSVFGGGGGGGGANSGAGGNGGTSTYGGNGSAGAVDANNSAAGTQPGGGSGGTEGGNSGAGGDGKCVVYVY